MVSSKIKTKIDGNISDVWAIVTSLDNFKWRSDLKNIKVVDEKTFIEYSKDGFETVFTVTFFKPCEIWEFDMNNANMTGHWSGRFSETEDGVELDFTESVEVKKWFLVPIVKLFLKSQQRRYIRDLTEEVSRRGKSS